MNNLDLLGRIQILDIVFKPALVAERFMPVGRSFVGDGDTKPFVEKGHLLEARAKCFKVEVGGFENAGVGPEGDCCSGFVGCSTLGEWLDGDSVSE